MSADRPTVLCAGTVSLDTVESGARAAYDVLGGSAPYFAAAARLESRVSIVGAVGEDFPEDQIKRLQAAGIGVSALARAPGETFRWHVRYQRDGSRQTVKTNRARALATTLEVPPELAEPQALFLGSTDPSVQASALRGAGTPELVVLDTMSHWIHDRREDFEMLTRSADVVLLNEEEAKILGDGDYEKGVRPILEGGCSWVVVKRGDQGAIAFGHDRAIAASAPRVPGLVDPTGAGDAFAGGLVSTLAREWPATLGMEAALKNACAMGSFAIESFSIDRLLEITAEGAVGRGREVSTKMRLHRSAP